MLADSFYGPFETKFGLEIIFKWHVKEFSSWSNFSRILIPFSCGSRIASHIMNFHKSNTTYADFSPVADGCDSAEEHVYVNLYMETNKSTLFGD